MKTGMRYSLLSKYGIVLILRSLSSVPRVFCVAALVLRYTTGLLLRNLK